MHDSPVSLNEVMGPGGLSAHLRRDRGVVGGRGRAGGGRAGDGGSTRGGARGRGGAALGE